MKTAFAALLALLTLALLAACGGEEGGAPSPTASATPAASPTGSPLAGVCRPNPDPAEPDVVQVDSPAAGLSVQSPVTVSGRIAAFEAQFKITVFDATGNAIAQVFGVSAEGQTLAPFSEAVTFSVDTPTPACIWVYEESAAGTGPIHVLQVPVTLEPSAAPGVCQTNPDPAEPDQLEITDPAPGASVSSPLTIKGRIVAFEGTFQVAIFDAAGNPIVETFGTSEAAEMGELGPFSIDLAFQVSTPTPACLWVWEASPEDGSTMDVGQVEVTLQP